MIVLTCARRAVASRQGGLRLMNTHAHGGGGSGLRNGIMGAAIFSFVGGVYWYTIGKMQQEADIFAELDTVIDEDERRTREREEAIAAAKK